MWENPVTLSEPIVNMAKRLDCNWIGAIPVQPIAGYDENNCHNNVITQCTISGGNSVIGYYFIQGFNTVQAIRHSVWKTNNELIDITPYTDNRDYIIFGTSNKNVPDYRIRNCYLHSLDKYLEQETELMYYVYQLVDPRNNQPFYVGKGTGNRSHTHLWKSGFTHNQYKENKIASIRADGYEPIIVYVAENIIDEELAYSIESQLISQYGRKGYEQDGILTNVCSDNRPPNHKGKSYEEIYGPEKAKQQRELRSKLQKERGGYGPDKHSAETRRKISEATTGNNNPMYGKNHTTETRLLIGKANKKYTGKLNKKSKCYKLTSPAGDVFILYGGEAAAFCKEHNLSYSTLKMQIQQNWGVPKKGKTKGWKFEEHR